MSDINLNELDFGRLSALACILIPGDEKSPGAKDIAAYKELLKVAVKACGYSSSEVAEAFEAIPEPCNWAGAKEFACSRPHLFSIASTLASGAYFMSPVVLRSLNFATDRQNPGDAQDFLNEYETGVLEQVVNRGQRFRKV